MQVQWCVFCTSLPSALRRERQIQNVDVAVWTSIELLSCVQEADMSIPTCSSEKFPLGWQSFCAETSPKLEVSTPCSKTKRNQGGCHTKDKGHVSTLIFQAKYKLLRPGQSGGVLRTSPSRKNLGFSVWNNGKQGQCAVQIWLHCP